MLPVPPKQLASVPRGLAATAAGAPIETGAAGLRQLFPSRATTLCGPTATLAKLPLTWKAAPSSENRQLPLSHVAVALKLRRPPMRPASVPRGLAATAAGAPIETGAAGLRQL